MKAFVITNKENSSTDLTLFRQYLAQYGVQCYEFTSVLELEKSCVNFPHEPILFFPNIWTRFDNPDEIIKFHKQHSAFKSLVYNGEFLTYYPKYIRCINDTIFCQFDAPKELFSIKSGIRKTFVTPTAEPLHIFITSHNRANYFDLTMNSLIYSLEGSEKVIVILNEATEAVKKIAFKYILYPNFEFIEIEKNCFYSSLNIGLQLFKPKKFMNFEDDFILPQSAKEWYPFWSRQFSHLLDEYDLVGWSPNVDNAPTFHRFPKPPMKPFGSWDTKSPLLLGQALSMRFDYYKKVLHSELDHWYTPLDSKLHKYTSKICTPTLKGYHIGWNQELDGYGKVVGRPDFVPPKKNFARNSKTKEIMEIDLERILEL